MARIPFADIPRKTPPYVRRKDVDNALDKTGDRPAKRLAIIGTEPAMGVTRTLREFVDRAPGIQFHGGGGRYPVVLDLFAHAHLSPVENLVHARNALVKCVNKIYGISSFGRYLLPFDALYSIWQMEGRVEGRETVELFPTKKLKLGKKATRLVIRIGTAGLIEFVGTAADIMQILDDDVMDVVGHATGEHIAGDFIERSISNFQQFLLRKAVPRLSPRLRAGLGSDQLDGRHFSFLMHDLLIEALKRIQQDLAEKGLIILAVDAIDEVDVIETVHPLPIEVIDYDGPEKEDLDESADLRFVLTGLLSNGCADISGIFCGRAPAEKWFIEAGELQVEPLGLLPPQDIRRMLIGEKLSENSIERIMATLGAVNAVKPKALTTAFRRHARQ